MPHVRAEALEHHGTNGCTALAMRMDLACNLLRDVGSPWTMIRNHRHMPDLHDEIRRDRRQELVLSLAQRECDAMRAVGVDDATRVAIVVPGGAVDLGMQRDGLARPIAAHLLAVVVEA